MVVCCVKYSIRQGHSVDGVLVSFACQLRLRRSVGNAQMRGPLPPIPLSRFGAPGCLLCVSDRLPRQTGNKNGTNTAYGGRQRKRVAMADNGSIAGKDSREVSSVFVCVSRFCTERERALDQSRGACSSTFFLPPLSPSRSLLLSFSLWVCVAVSSPCFGSLFRHVAWICCHSVLGHMVHTNPLREVSIHYKKVVGREGFAMCCHRKRVVSLSLYFYCCLRTWHLLVRSTKYSSTSVSRWDVDILMPSSSWLNSC